MGGECRHGDDPAKCISCEMLKQRPDKQPPYSAAQFTDDDLRSENMDYSSELPNIPITCGNCERWKAAYVASQQMLRDTLADAIESALEQSGDYEKLPDGKWQRRKA